MRRIFTGIALTIAVLSGCGKAPAVKPVAKKRAPTVVNTEPAKATEATAKRRSLPIKAKDLIRVFNEPPRFVIRINRDDYVLMNELRSPDRVFIFIEPGPDGMAIESEVSVLVRDTTKSPEAITAYFETCKLFLETFGDEGDSLVKHLTTIAEVCDDIAKGVRRTARFDLPKASIVFERGPRDFMDAFLLKAAALDQ